MAGMMSYFLVFFQGESFPEMISHLLNYSHRKKLVRSLTEMTFYVCGGGEGEGLSKWQRIPLFQSNYKITLLL